MKRLANAVATLAFASALRAHGSDSTPPKLRLPAGVAPTRYALEMWLDPSKDTFKGKAEIRISLKGESDTLWLNGTELSVESASATATGGKDAIAAEATAGADRLRIHFQRNLAPGDYDVTLTYTGRVDAKDTDGVFRQKEGDAWYAFTQFEPIFARRAFPCFDEPSFKTPWRLTIHVPRGAMAVSNTPVLSETAEAEGGRKFVFAPTKPLPSYLVAFGVGPFEIVNAGIAGRNKTSIRFIVPKGRGVDVRWAAESIGPILDALESYFGIPYPYEKLDNLVIPQTNIAMENPGLVTYPSFSVLAKPADETIAFRRGWAGICAHETAHQWFGDSVTMAWWDDIWLNEAFATWIASKIVDRWKPEWKEQVDRAVDVARAMQADSFATARRIRQPIVTSDDIASAFDAITYTKGAAVLAMFEGWLGEEAFRRGIQTYLRDHAWGSATSEDFVAAIAEATRNPAVAPAFRSFLDQAGVPLLTAELDCRGDVPKLLLSQRRFLPIGSTGPGQATWHVPVCTRVGDPGAERTCTLLTKGAGQLELTGACPARLLVNAGDGYYHVLYKGGLLRELLAESGAHMSSSERVETLSDISALAQSGDLSMAAALGLVKPFSGDPAWRVVEAVRLVAAYSGDLLVSDEFRAHYRRFVSDALGERAQALGWETRPAEDEEARLLRTVLVPFVAAKGDEPSLVAEAGRLAKEWLKDNAAVDPLMVPAVLGAAARFGDAELLQAYVAQARKGDQQQRARLFEAIGHFRDPAVLPAALALTLSSEFDARETIDILWRETRDPETLPRAWEFLKANFDQLAARLPRDEPASFPWMAGRFGDLTRRAEVEAFFKDRSPKYLGGPRSLAGALEQIQLRAALKAAQQGSVTAFLKRYETRSAGDLKPGM